MTTRRTLLIAAPLVPIVAGLLPSRLCAAARGTVMLYKSPACGCCEGYADYLRQHGLTVTIRESEKLEAISANAGVPADLQGCHTAFIGGYVIDGHVPIEAVNKVLDERRDLKGLTLPGMPSGSPGMPGDKEGRFLIHAIGRDGKTRPYMTI